MMKTIGILLMLITMGEAMAFRLVGELRLPTGSAEILSYDPATHLVFSTRGSWTKRGVVVISLGDGVQPRVTGEVDLRKVHAKGVKSVSSVAADPLGRGILAAAVIPNGKTENRGLVALICTQSLKVVHLMECGWHPDCVNFSKDGRYLLVACEGEYSEGKTNTPGSLSVIDFSGIRGVGEVGRLRVSDYPLGPAQVGPGLRFPYERERERLHLDFEPEYVVSDGQKVWVSLQENNGIGVFDLRTRRWAAVRSLGSWPVRIDAGDRDGPWARREIQVDDVVQGLPMPDTIAALKVGGRNLVFSANEGEGDRVARVKHLGNGSPPLCPAYRARLKAVYGVDPGQDGALGRLQVSLVDGLNERGHIAKLHMVGTRSFSIWDGNSGKRIYDSGSFFEDFAAKQDRRSFNHNDGALSKWDRRSDNRGPETEALAAGWIGGRPVVFVGNERQNGLFAFDVRSPENPRLIGYYSGGHHGHSNPENILVLPKSATSQGRELILTAWERSSSITIHQL